MKKFLIISQAFYLLCTVPWLAIWGLSFMSFDNGVALGNSLFVTTIGLYPIAVIISAIIAWRLRLRNKRAATLINLVPMLWIAGIALLLLF